MLQNFSQDSIIDSDDIKINTTAIKYNNLLKNNINSTKNINKSQSHSIQMYNNIDYIDDIPTNQSHITYNPYALDMTNINQLQYSNISDSSRCLCLLFIFALVVTFAIIYKNT